MNRDQLQACTKKQLARMARDQGVVSWHGMRKDELVSALTPSPASRKKASRPQPHPPIQAGAARNTAPSGEACARCNPATAPAKDRIVAVVRDPFWLHCCWEISRAAIERAEAALAHEWHTAGPILRVFDVTARDISGASERVVRDIAIHASCTNWYIDVPQPPKSYRIDVGYLSRSGRFYAVARSNVVTTPRAGMSDAIDENWADLDDKKAEHIYAMSSGYQPTAASLDVKQFLDEKLRRPIGAPAITSLGSGGLFSPAAGGGLVGHSRDFWFQLDAELVVYGATQPSARVTLQGQPVGLRPDGTFTMRFKLPDCRQILQAVATSPDGSEDRTIILAVERNTRVLPPMPREAEE